MAETVSCPGCQTKLKLKPEYAGKKIKCPRCARLITIPNARGVTTHPPKIEKTAAGKRKPSQFEDEDAAVITEPKRKKKGQKSDMSPCPECGEMVDNDATKCPHCKTPLETDEEEEYKKWKKCPNCRQQMGRRVLWTIWGSFYFTALFKHVKCQECGTTYNGKTGRSNLGLAIICIGVELLALAGIGFIVTLILKNRNYEPAEWLTMTNLVLTIIGGVGFLAGIILWAVGRRG